MNHVIDIAKGALKLLDLHMQHPNTVSHKQASDAAQDALQALESYGNTSTLLEDTHRAVRSVLDRRLQVMVSPVEMPNTAVRVAVLDGSNVIYHIEGNSPKALAEIVRLQLLRAA